MRLIVFSLFSPVSLSGPCTATSFVVVVELQQLIVVTSPGGQPIIGAGPGAAHPIRAPYERCH